MGNRSLDGGQTKKSHGQPKKQNWLNCPKSKLVQTLNYSKTDNLKVPRTAVFDLNVDRKSKTSFEDLWIFCLTRYFLFLVNLTI